MEKETQLIMLYLHTAIQMLEVSQTYTKKFEESKNEYISPTRDIKIDDMMNHFVVAGIVAPNEELPILGKDGYSNIFFTPDSIGGQFPYGVDDILSVKAGMSTYTVDGKEVTSEEAIKAKYSKIGASSIVNRKERQCADAYLKGIYVNEKGRELEVGVKANVDLDWSGKIASDEIIAMNISWATKKGKPPVFEAGVNVFNALKNEARDSRQNINDVKFVTVDTDSYLLVSNIKVILLLDAVGTDGNYIDTSNMLILSDRNTIGIGYGVLVWGDVKTNQTKVKPGKIIGGELRVEVTSGSNGIWVKSSPMPIVINANKFIRYNMTLPVNGAPIDINLKTHEITPEDRIPVETQYDAPTIETQPSDVEKVEGTNATFTTSALMAASYQWQVDETGVGDDFVDIGGEISNTLVLTAVASGMDGNLYRVVATNSIGQVISSTAVLTVTV